MYISLSHSVTHSLTHLTSRQQNILTSLSLSASSPPLPSSLSLLVPRHETSSTRTCPALTASRLVSSCLVSPVREPW